MKTLVAFVLSVPLPIISVIWTMWYAVHKREGVSAEFSLCPFRFSLRTFVRVSVQCSESIPKWGEQLPPTDTGEPLSTPRKVLPDHDTAKPEKRVGALPPPLGEG